MKNPKQLRPRTAKYLMKGLMPHLLLPLIRKKIIREEHLQEPLLIAHILAKHSRIAVREMQWIVAMDDSFLDAAIKYWKKEKLISVVLFATAVEQNLNQGYQLLLSAQGWKKQDITALLRKVNIEGKLGWMFKYFAKRPFPKPLAKRLILLSQVRNSIVHFKGEAGNIDKGDDSYSKVEERLKDLHRMSLSRDFKLLDTTMISAIMAADPARGFLDRVMDAIRPLLK